MPFYPHLMQLKHPSDRTSKMVAVLDVKAEDETERPAVRVPLGALSALGAEELTGALHRALPGAEGGARIPVAAFNSSI
jgi:FXSXX-COOH protein